jgi:hypothetical protein
MLQAKDVRLGRTVSTKALMTAGPVFKGGTAYARLAMSWVCVVFEFVKKGRRWECVGIGREDLPQYAGMFPPSQIL